MALPAHRASDAEREETAERLRVAAGDGRLDHDELEQRLEAAYSARTVGELAELTADLPARAPDPDARPPVLADQAVRAKLATFIVANVVCIAIWALTGADGSFWPKWVLFGTGVALFATIVQRALGVEGDEREHEPLGPPQLPGEPRR
jgi:hypothetical protein